TLLPRLLAAGGDPRRVHFITGAREGGRSRSFDPATDLPKLMEAARRLPNLRLLILDCVVSVVTGDSHKNTETRRSLQPVVDLAAKLHCAALGLTHISKNTSGREPLERVAGSLAFGAVARVVLLTVKPADPKAPRRLVRAKSNLGPDYGGFAYRLYGALLPEQDFSAQAVEWGEELQGSAWELMAVEQHDGVERSSEAAKSFLKDFLAKGPIATKEVKAAAEAHGHRWRTVERAKGLLGVTAIKRGLKGRWAWQLPPSKTASSSPDRQQE
ncbi:MAG: AAA family ATPase, partial [Solimonas sp.]